ncbi:hypothetical protein ZWY2020_039851 [Hordeum vulgare]|nr:hypothetical protein ZWY2020_039851 [Hordeum vulgare]
MQKVRAHTGNRDNQWDLMHLYLQILELEEPIARMKVIHVAGIPHAPAPASRGLARRAGPAPPRTPPQPRHLLRAARQ